MHKKCPCFHVGLGAFENHIPINHITWEILLNILFCFPQKTEQHIFESTWRWRVNNDRICIFGDVSLTDTRGLYFLKIHTSVVLYALSHSLEQSTAKMSWWFYNIPESSTVTIYLHMLLTYCMYNKVLFPALHHLGMRIQTAKKIYSNSPRCLKEII